MEGQEGLLEKKSVVNFLDLVFSDKNFDWVVNLSAQEVWCSGDTLLLFNFEDKLNFLPQNLYKKLFPSNAEEFKRLYNMHRKDCSSFEFEHRLRDSNISFVTEYSFYNLSDEAYLTAKSIAHHKNGVLIHSKEDSPSKTTYDMSFWVDKDSNFIDVNENVCAYLGYTREELKTMSVFDVDVLMPKEAWYKHWDLTKAWGSFTFETEHRKKNGDFIKVELVANYLETDDFEINYTTGRLIDPEEEPTKINELDKVKEQLEVYKLQNEAVKQYIQEESHLIHPHDHIIYKSEKFKSILKKVEQVAPTDTTVLITGETGTGKELLAQQIHHISNRGKEAFIKINCAALPKELIESELFGHEKGAFTGATQKKMGRFQLAHKGTLFLDEIGEMPLELQPKILRALQEKEITPIGASKSIKVDVRVVSATNRNLQQMVFENTFRQDLFYRLNVFPIESISLRYRKEDIEVLAQYFLNLYSAKINKTFLKISAEALAQLKNYHFPGNIRELENIIERAVILEDGPVLGLGAWLPNQLTNITPDSDIIPFAEMQKKYIVNTLMKTDWKVSGDNGAAQLLQINTKTLFSKMAKLGIKKEDYISYKSLI